MRFRIGPPPEDDTVIKEAVAWKVVDEPSLRNQMIVGLGIGLLTAACVALVVSLSLGHRHLFHMSGPMVILFIVLIVPFHELLHAAAFEGGPTSDRAILGFYPKALAFYAYYRGAVTRIRYLVIAALPLFVLTIVPLIVQASFRLDSTHLTEVILANGFASAIDVLTIWIVLTQVPRHSVLLNSGMKTYWKPQANGTPESYRP